MQPFLLQPVYKDYLWGGTNLKAKYGKKTSLEIVAESWELSAHPDGSSVVASGPLAGESFAELLQKKPEICGTKCKGMKDFPLLIKLIDAQKSLSIQVHPDDEYARVVEGEAGKTEMWIVLDCEPEAFLYFGFEHSITKEEMKQRIENNTLTEVLHKYPVEKCSVVYIPAGTIHAIGAGITLAEIQQNSNSTYRVYDFGRRGPDGNLRELHVEKALEVTKLEPAEEELPGEEPAVRVAGSTVKKLVESPYFSVTQLCLEGNLEIATNEESFLSILCTNGAGAIEWQGGSLPLVKGSSAFVPAESGGITLAGEGEFILTSV